VINIPSNTNNSDLLARSTSVGLEGRVNSNTTTHHRRRIRAVKTLRDLQDKVAVRTVVRGVSTVGLASVGPLSTVGVRGLGAVVLVTGLALLALEARAGLGADADTVADLDVLDLLADADGFADDLVANAAWVAGRWLAVALVADVVCTNSVGPQPLDSMWRSD